MVLLFQTHMNIYSSKFRLDTMQDYKNKIASVQMCLLVVESGE